jgi:serine/threonine-protein kinase RsbW
VKHVKIPSTWEAVQEAGQAVLKEVAEAGFDESTMFSIRLALEEGLINAVKHGNKMDPSKFVDLAYEITAEQVEIHLSDEGPGFNPCGVPDPTEDENLEKPSGRGIMLMRSFMDKVEYLEDGKKVRMVKYRE